VERRDYAELTPRAGTDETDILRDLVRRGVAVRSFTTTRTSLDEIFIKIYGRQNQPVGV
jgi:ABC-2 type transport system ATP-binding protein